MSSTEQTRSSSCPPQEDLEAFALGRMDAQSLDAIAEHLDQCAQCPSELERYDSQTDALTSRLRELQTDGDPSQGGLSRGTVAVPSLDKAVHLRDWLRSDPAHARLGRFELEEELGEGSFGVVFKARDTELDRWVALKIERRPSTRDAESERFLREARSAAQLEHPGIVSLYEANETADGLRYLVTEYIDGRTLEECQRERRFEPREAARVVRSLAAALGYAHSRGIIHRDIKPSNTLIDKDGCPHIADFGLAKREQVDSTVTAKGQTMGTPSYMSPEQAVDAHAVDARSDVYSLGVVLYELLTGERPFQGHRRMILLQVLEDDPRPPRRLDDRIPRDLETICLKAMAKTAARRYRDAGEFEEDLTRFLEEEPIRARRSGALDKVWRWSVRNPVVSSLVASLVLGVVVALIHLAILTETLVEQTALQSAALQTEMLEEINDIYSEIVERQDLPFEEHVGPYHWKRDSPARLPLPAELTIEAGRRISGSASGMRVHLFSDHPFPWREDGGPRDGFQVRSLEKLKAAPGVAIHEIDEVEGRPALRYAKARVMKASCIRCHNEHPQSPKQDWVVGDVRGVLEIVRPLDRDFEATSEGVRGAFLKAFAIGSSGWGAILILWFYGRKRRGTKR